jgi:hypothetical protein
MDELGQLTAEFETLGEAVVADRLSHNLYKGEARAVAMRWLNDRSLARIGIDVPIHDAHVDPNLRRIVRNEQITRAAILCAIAALLASVGALGLSVQTLQAVQDLRHTAAVAAAQSAAQPAAAPKPVSRSPRS